MVHTCRGTVNLAGAFIDTIDATNFVITNGPSQVWDLTYMWQSHVENEHYSYHILTMIVTLLWNLPESSNLSFSNFNLSARSEPTSGFNCQSIILGELIELS